MTNDDFGTLLFWAGIIGLCIVFPPLILVFFVIFGLALLR